MRKSVAAVPSASSFGSASAFGHFKVHPQTRDSAPNTVGISSVGTPLRSEKITFVTRESEMHQQPVKTLKPMPSLSAPSSVRPHTAPFLPKSSPNSVASPNTTCTIESARRADATAAISPSAPEPPTPSSATANASSFLTSNSETTNPLHSDSATDSETETESEQQSPSSGEPKIREIALLGDGRYSTVHKVVILNGGDGTDSDEEGDDEDECVLKKWRNQRRTDEREHIRTEANTLYSCQSANVVRFVGTLLNPPNAGILTELCTAGNLRDYVETDPDDARTCTKRWSIELENALRCVHERGYVHRDVKPENCLLTDDGNGKLRLKLGDFGHATSKDTAEVRVVGTALWSAPELSTGAATEKSDTYSYGLVVAFVIKGSPHIGGAKPSLPSSTVERSWSAFVAECVRTKPVARPSHDMILCALASLPESIEPKREKRKREKRNDERSKSKERGRAVKDTAERNAKKARGGDDSGTSTDTDLLDVAVAPGRHVQSTTDATATKAAATPPALMEVSVLVDKVPSPLLMSASARASKKVIQLENP